MVNVRETGQLIYENVFNIVNAKNNDESCPLNKANYSTELCEKLIRMYFKKGETIMDIFGGTGTTAIACYRNDNDFIYFELSEAQCEWAKDRYDVETSQYRMII